LIFHDLVKKGELKIWPGGGEKTRKAISWGKESFIREKMSRD